MLGMLLWVGQLIQERGHGSQSVVIVPAERAARAQSSGIPGTAAGSAADVVAVEPNVFLRLEADLTGGRSLLKASWIRMDGKHLHEHTIEAGDSF